MSARSEPSVTMNSTKKDKIKSKTIPTKFMSKETEISSEVGEKQLTTTAPLISKANEIQTSTKVEVKNQRKKK
jgi:hypothetical protein